MAYVVYGQAQIEIHICHDFLDSDLTIDELLIVYIALSLPDNNIYTFSINNSVWLLMHENMFFLSKFYLVQSITYRLNCL